MTAKGSDNDGDNHWIRRRKCKQLNGFLIETKRLLFIRFAGCCMYNSNIPHSIHFALSATALVLADSHTLSLLEGNGFTQSKYRANLLNSSLLK